MTGIVLRAPGGAYESAGRQSAVAVRGYSSVLVVSDDAEAAAHTAIGIALAESAQRLVMIGDLAGEVAPIQGLVRDDDSHGIYDSFAFGTSFTKIARQVEGQRNMFVMPSGTESAAVREVIASPRWRTFASEFANADELLLLVARFDAPGIEELAGRLDGAVLVGVSALDAAPDTTILARIPHPAPPVAPRVPVAGKRPKKEGPGRFRPVGLLGALLLLAAGIAGGAWYSRIRPAPVALPEPVAVDSALDAPPRPAAIPIANSQDSSRAAAFSIEILASNTAEGANFEMNRHGPLMPAATVSLVPVGDTESTWYKVHSGAFEDSVEAETLLATLRRRRIVPDSAGSIVRTPFALRVDSIEAQAGITIRARERVRELRDQGVHAYALMQADGSARIYAGAFDRPQHSTLAATALRVAGLSPVLEYRTGRVP